MVGSGTEREQPETLCVFTLLPLRKLGVVARRRSCTCACRRSLPVGSYPDTIMNQVCTSRHPTRLGSYQYRYGTTTIELLLYELVSKHRAGRGMHITRIIQ